MSQGQKEAKATVLIAIFLAAGTLGLYAPVHDHDFVHFDDDRYIVQNPSVNSGLSWANLSWAMTSPGVSNWHPLTWVSHMIDVELFGLNPGPPHLINALFHTLNALLLFTLLRRLSLSLLVAAWIASVFACHPLRVESVAWISERKDVLSASMFFLACHSYLRFASSKEAIEKRPWWRRRGAFSTTLFLILGLASKPMVVTLPLVFMLLDYWPLKRRWALREKIPWFTLSLILAVVTVIFQDRAGALKPLSYISVESRLLQAPLAWLTYLRMGLWPTNLACFYPHPALVMESSSWVLSLLSTLALVAISWGSWVLRRSHPYCLFGWMWFLLTTLPIIGLIQVGEQAYADRYTYLPFIGITIAIGLAFVEKTKSWPVPRFCLRPVALVTVLALLPLTSTLIDSWKNTRTLFGRALAVTENNFLAHNQIGLMNLRENRLSEAESSFRRSLEILPTYRPAQFNLGQVALRAQRWKLAIDEFQKVIDIDPTHPESHYNLGVLYVRTQKLPLAEKHFAKALRARPSYAKAERNLAKVRQALAARNSQQDSPP